MVKGKFSNRVGGVELIKGFVFFCKILKFYSFFLMVRVGWGDF